MSPTEEHWFDRLVAAPHTRRQGLKAALAGFGAALTLPLWRSSPAAASHGDCHAPCSFEAQLRSSDRLSGCRLGGNIEVWGGYLSMLLVNPLVGSFQALSGTAGEISCNELAVIRSKNDHARCMLAGCGGYTPDPRVLCPGCLEAGGKCCPDPATSYQAKHTCCACCRPAGGCTACGG